MRFLGVLGGEQPSLIFFGDHCEVHSRERKHSKFRKRNTPREPNNNLTLVVTRRHLRYWGVQSHIRSCCPFQSSVQSWEHGKTYTVLTQKCCVSCRWIVKTMENYTRKSWLCECSHSMFQRTFKGTSGMCLPYWLSKDINSWRCH